MSSGGLGSPGLNERTVLIDAFPEAALRYPEGWAIVAVDVIRATTTAVTAVSTGRRCFLAPTVDAAAEMARTLEDPLLAGEIGGNTPFGFEMNNSPAEMAIRGDTHRPAVLVTSSGTLLAHNASRSGHAFLACFRNVIPTVQHLATRYSRVVVIGAGSRAEFREEDQACCARIAEGLVGAGFAAGDGETGRLIQRWSGARDDRWLVSNSVRFLEATGQSRDLEFILNHRDDVGHVVGMSGSEVVSLETITTGAAGAADPVTPPAAIREGEGP